jgi:hypothetical protein
MKELSRPTATLREEDTLIETSSRGVFYPRIIKKDRMKKNVFLITGFTELTLAETCWFRV